MPFVWLDTLQPLIRSFTEIVVEETAYLSEWLLVMMRAFLRVPTWTLGLQQIALQCYGIVYGVVLWHNTMARLSVRRW